MSVTPVEDDIRKVTLPRPGHADLAGVQKYGFDDIRNVLERVLVALNGAVQLLDQNLAYEARVDASS